MILKKNQQMTKKHETLPIRQRVKNQRGLHIRVKNVCSSLILNAFLVHIGLKLMQKTNYRCKHLQYAPGCVVQSVTSLTADTCLTADPGSRVLSRPCPILLVEIDHETNSTAFLLPSADSRRIVVSYKRKYVHKVLVKCLFRLAQEKCLVR